jgi:hypothetical protein
MRVFIAIALGFPGRPAATLRWTAGFSGDGRSSTDGGRCLDGRIFVFTEVFLGRIDIRASTFCVWLGS